MAKKNKKSKNSFSQKYEVDKNKKKRYQNPTKTRIGKILIVILALAMVFGIVFSLVWVIIHKFF